MFFMSRHQFDTDLSLNNQAFIPALPVGKLSYLIAFVYKRFYEYYWINKRCLVNGRTDALIEKRVW